MRRPVVAFFLVVLSTVSWRPAAADLAGDAYQDAKSVIEELLTAEITRSLVPQIVCRAGRQEAVFNDPDCSTEASAAASSGFSDPASATVCLRRGDRRQRVTLKLLEYFPGTLQALYSRRFASLRSTVGSEVIDVASDTLYESLRGNLRDIQRQATRDPAVRTALDYANEIAPASATVFSQLEAPALRDCLEQVTAKLSAGLVTSVSRLDRECAPSREGNALECELAQSLRLALRGKAAEAEARLRRAVALILAHCLLAQPLFADWPPTTTTTTTAGDGRDDVRDDVRLKRIADELTVLMAQLERPGGDPELAFAGFTIRLAAVLGVAKEKLEPLISGKRGSILQVASRVRAITRDGAVPLTLASLISDLADVLRGPGALCEGVSSPACNFLDEIPWRIGTRSLVWSAVTAAASGDLRGVAHLVLSALFPRDTAGSRCDQQSGSEGCKADTFRRFADSLVMYVLDATDGDASVAVRAVFRQSAAEVVRFISPFGGIDREEPVLLLTPELLMRASWSSGYLDAGDDRLRYAVGVNLLRLRKVLVYTGSSYAALQLSLIDPIAPIAELVLRAERTSGPGGADTGAEIRYRQTGKVFWNVISPRLELTAALPWFSKHLAVSAGVGLRLVAPTEQTTEGSGDSAVPTSTYRGLLHDADDWYDFLEVALALKYLL
jgi:hypothetical protein